MLENMGVRVEGEKSFTISRKDAPAIYIHDFFRSCRCTAHFI